MSEELKSDEFTDQRDAEKATAEAEPSESSTPQSEVVLPLSDDERAASAEVRDDEIANARERLEQIVGKSKAPDYAPTQRFVDHQAETQARLAQGRLERSNKQRAEQGLKPRAA